MVGSRSSRLRSFGLGPPDSRKPFAFEQLGDHVALAPAVPGHARRCVGSGRAQFWLVHAPCGGVVTVGSGSGTAQPLPLHARTLGCSGMTHLPLEHSCGGVVHPRKPCAAVLPGPELMPWAWAAEGSASKLAA